MQKQLKDLLDRALRLKESKDYRGALQLLSTVINNYPDSAVAFGLKGGIYYFDLAQAKKAIPYFKNATRISPLSETASLGLFHTLWDSGSHDEAIAEMTRFRSVSHSDEYDAINAELDEKGLLHAQTHH